MSRGFVILAQNTDKIDYIKCANALAISIRRVMPEAAISLITTNTFVQSKTSPLFDHVVTLPLGDLAPNSDWKLINDFQVYDASPYDETIKIEADMFITHSLDHWWEVLGQQDVVVASTIRNFKGEISNCRVYRKFIDDNELPEVYNALTYFKKSALAKSFFDIVRDVFEHWSEYKQIMKCNPQEEVTTDWAYAIASHIIGVEKTTMPGFTEFSMTHMKQYVNGLPGEDWTKTLVYECLPDVLRIHTYPQMYPLHYHVKTFADIIIKSYK